MNDRHMIIGVISDTHGLLRPAALKALAGVDRILHAGDIGDPTILDELRQIAPVTAIRGNVDTKGPCSELPATEAIELYGRLFYLIHSVHDLDLKPEAAGIAMVVSGHSHNPEIETRNEVIYLNPGSAGPRRFKLPISLARVLLTRKEIFPTLIDLEQPNDHLRIHFTSP
jgi:putative phosphoesterase